ncbi:unnamed protein product [Caenorhabditis nigoni]
MTIGNCVLKSGSRNDKKQSPPISHGTSICIQPLYPQEDLENNKKMEWITETTSPDERGQHESKNLLPGLLKAGGNKRKMIDQEEFRQPEAEASKTRNSKNEREEAPKKKWEEFEKGILVATAAKYELVRGAESQNFFQMSFGDAKTEEDKKVIEKAEAVVITASKKDFHIGGTSRRVGFAPKGKSRNGASSKKVTPSKSDGVTAMRSAGKALRKGPVKSMDSKKSMANPRSHYNGKRREAPYVPSDAFHPRANPERLNNTRAWPNPLGGGGAPLPHPRQKSLSSGYYEAPQNSRVACCICTSGESTYVYGRCEYPQILSCPHGGTVRSSALHNRGASCTCTGGESTYHYGRCEYQGRLAKPMSMTDRQMTPEKLEGMIQTRSVAKTLSVLKQSSKKVDDRKDVAELRKPTTRCLHSPSFQSVQLYEDRLDGSTSKEGQGWMRMDHEDNSEED